MMPVNKYISCYIIDYDRNPYLDWYWIDMSVLFKYTIVENLKKKMMLKRVKDELLLELKYNKIFVLPATNEPL